MEQVPISLIEPKLPAVKWKLNRQSPNAESKLSLDADQQRVVDHRKGPMLVLAGPGTGKTATLTEAVIARLSEANPLSASEVLVLTFGRKAAREIRERIVQRLGGGLVPTVCTFHSLAISLLRDYQPEIAEQMQLLTGPEQDLRLREILDSYVEGKLPETLAPAAKTRGLAVEVRNAVARAQTLGLRPEQLSSLSANSEEWKLVSSVFADYLDNVDGRSQMDYNELIQQALVLVQKPAVKELLHLRFKAIFVDEYQDTDPLQIELLKNLVGADACLVAVGDPDQSIYGFRGADERSIADFANDFKYMNNGKVEFVALHHTRRFGHELQAAAAAVITKTGTWPSTSPLAQLNHRQLITDPEIKTSLFFTEYESAEAEAESVAEEIRKLVLTSDGKLKWSDISILVRSGVRSIPTLERALLQAGVPVVTAFDDLPLGQEPAVATLLLALECAVNRDKLNDPVNARTLLTSPLAGLNPADMRRVARLIRNTNALDGDFSETLLARSLSDPKLTIDIEPDVGGEALRRLVQLQQLLIQVRAKAEKGASLHELLWLLWEGTNWPQQLRENALSQALQANSANHDLDAVITLFEIAAEKGNVGGRPIAKIANFVADVRNLLVSAQSLEPVLTPNAVSLMTAHRAKGLQWQVVFICSADEGTWPDVRRRNSILEPDRLTLMPAAAGLKVELLDRPARVDLVNEECRLFFVAMTRAKSKLYISSTSLAEDEEKLPSRFIKRADAFLTKNADNAESQSVAARHSFHALVAQLRRIGTDPETAPDLRLAVVQRLKRLSDLRDESGNLLVPAANPSAWWGIAQPTENLQPIEPVDQPIKLRGSSLPQLRECRLKWFLQNRAKADELAGHAAVFGNVVHAIAGGILTGEIPRDNPELIATKIDSVWQQVRFEAPWIRKSEFEAAKECVARFIGWLAAQEVSSKPTYYSEVSFEQDIEFKLLDGSTRTFHFKGSIDLLEIVAPGQAYVVDLKTGRSRPNNVKINPQLWMYQYAVNLGIAKPSDVSEPLTSAGAELVHLRLQPTNKEGRAAGVMRNIQPAIPPVGSEGNPFEKELAENIQILISENYYPTPEQNMCKRCSFKPVCPVQPEGDQVI